MADDAFARSVSRWLRAYPRRWRAVRAAEVTDVLADLAAPGARRLDLRSGLGLVRAGWTTRWREHPPLLPWLGYVLLERRLGPRYRDWVADDISGGAYQARRMLLGTSAPLTVLLVATLSGGGLPSGFLQAFVPMMLIGAALWTRQVRDRAIAVQLVLHPGEVVTPNARIHALVPRDRVAALPALTAATAVAAAALTAGLLLVGAARTRIVAEGCGTACLTLDGAPVTAADRGDALVVVLVALAAGLLLAVVAAAGLRRWRPVPQPARVVVPLGAPGRWRAVALCGAAGLIVLWWPGMSTLAPVPLAVGGAVLLPVLAAARWSVGTGRTRAVAAVDVRRAVLGRPDRADRPSPGYLPATDWLPPGAIAPPPQAPAFRTGHDPYRA